jgi:PAS domain S-box-containing protein
MKLGLKRKIILTFVAMLFAVACLNTLLASYFTNRQNEDAAFAALQRDLQNWRDELQDTVARMRTVAFSTIGEQVALNQLAELKVLEHKMAGALSKNQDVKESAKTLAFRKSVQLNRLHLVLRSGGFSSIAVYIDGKLSHYVADAEAGMFVPRSGESPVWIKAVADINGNLPIRDWPAWQPDLLPPAAMSQPPIADGRVAFVYPSADSMAVEIAVPVEGIIEQVTGNETPTQDLSVLDAAIAGVAGNDPAHAQATQFAVVVFQKRIDSQWLQDIQLKTGMWPMLFSPDGLHSLQLGPLHLSLTQLFPDIAATQTQTRTIAGERGSFYTAALPWHFEQQPGFVLGLAMSRDSTLHNIRQTVAAILGATGLILSIGIGVGVFWVGRFINPIIALTEAVNAIGLVSRQERDKQPGYRSTADNLRPLGIRAPGEIGDLAWAFDVMIGELHYSFETLEQRVQERTAELRALHRTLEQQNRQLEKQSIKLSSGNDLLQEEIDERKWVEDLLRQREQEFRSLAENSPDNIARYDRDCRLTYMNTRLTDTLNKLDPDCRQQLGQKPTDIAPDDHFERYEATLAGVIETGLESEIEVVLPDTGDGLRYHLVRMVAERDGSGEITGALAIGRDITELKRTQEQLELLNRAINQSSDAIFLIDEQLRFTYVNDTACRVLGYSREELLALGPADIDPDISREYALDIMQTSQIGISSSFESRHRTRDGLVFPVEISSSHFEDNGALFGLAVVRDISERKKAEERLTLMNHALDRVKHGVYLIDKNGRIRHVNQEACRALGYSYDELVGMTISDIDSDCSPEDWPMHWDAVAVLGSKRFERYHRAKDGRVFPVEINTNHFEFDGQAYSLSLSHDITERKQYESNLLKRVQLEEQLSCLAASVPGFMFTLRVDANGHACFPFASAGIEQLFGLYPEDIRDDAAVLRERYHPEDLPRIVALTEETRRTLAPFRIEIRIIHPGHGLRWIEVRSMPQRYPDGGTEWHGLMIDVTERKQMDEALSKNRQILTEAQRISHVGSWELDLVNNNLAWSDEIFRIFEIDPEQFEASYEAFIERVHPDDREAVDRAYTESLQKREPYTIEHRLLMKDGRIKYVLERCETSYDEHGVPLVSLGTVQDITERKRMEAELKSQTDFQQTILDAIADSGIQLMMIEQGRILHVGNRKLAYEFGFTDEDIAAHPPLADIIHPDDRERIIANYARRLAGEPVPSNYELGLVTRSGERREYETSVAIVPNTDPVRMITVGKDITERKRTEQALARREQELRALAESSPGMVGSYYLRPDGGVCMPYASPNILELFGLRPEDVIDDASPLLRLNHPADAERVAASIAESARTMTPWHVEFRILHPTRGERWMEGNTNPFPHTDGGVIWYGYVHDITERKQAETEKQHLINILEQSADFIGSADMQGKLLYHNRAARRMLGLSEDADLSGLHISDMHPAWALEMVEQQGIPTLLEDGVWRCETAVRHRDGREIPVSQLLVLHRDADGEPLFHSTIMRDITDLKQAETEIRALNATLEQRVLERTEELRRQTHYLRTMIDTLPMMAWLKNTDSRFVVVNQAFAAGACGGSAGELIGKCDFDFWPREHAEAYRADDIEVMTTRRRKTVEEPFVDASNGTLWIETFKAPVIDEYGRVLGTVGLARDVSERKAVELARESALAEAERLARLRSEFMARMSHELRTPLNGILGYCQILLAEKRLDERQDVMVNVIQKSGEHLLSLINDILDFAKIEAGKQELSTSDIYLPGFLSDIAGIVAIRAEQKQLAFVCDIAGDVPAGVHADEKRLRQVLLNLLSNAVKYTERGQVCLRVTLLESGRLRFEVQDSGIGIEAGQLERIFRPFEQAGNSLGHSGGTGLGLVISRELVRLMDSDIQVRSQVGEGSFFWFELDVPVVDGFRDILPAEQYASGYRGARRRLLIVDDIIENRMLLLDILGRLGFETAEADSGKACLECAEAQMPDLVLLDMVIPNMDGLETARRLRRLPGFGQTPIIAISASASGTDVAEAMKAGIDVFLSKPIEMKQLLLQIGGLLKLEWLYALPEADASPQPKLEQWLDTPPMEEMSVLHRMAQEGSMRDIIQQTERLQALDERYRPFAEQLRKLCQNYQSKAVLDLVELYINRNAPDGD